MESKEQKPSAGRFTLSFRVDIEISGNDYPKDIAKSKFFPSLGKDGPVGDDLLNALEKAMQESGLDWAFAVNVSEIDWVENEDPVSTFTQYFLPRLRYIRGCFPEEASAVLKAMLQKEYFVFDAYRSSIDAGAKIRARVINALINKARSRLRSRLPTHGSGRPESRFTHNFITEKREFAESCFGVLELLERSGVKWTKSRLAEHMYPAGNSIKQLDQRLKKFRITFKQLIGSYKGTGPSISTVEDVRAQSDRYLKLQNLTTD